MFHVLWAICGAVGLLAAGRRDTLTKAVLYITIMPLANLPIQVWVSRAALWRCAPYGAVMAITGLCMVPVGARLLFFGDLTGLKLGVGSFFLLFSFARLTTSITAWGRERKQGGTAADSPIAGAPTGAGLDTPAATSTAVIVQGSAGPMDGVELVHTPPASPTSTPAPLPLSPLQPGTDSADGSVKEVAADAPSAPAGVHASHETAELDGAMLLKTAEGGAVDTQAAVEPGDRGGVVTEAVSRDWVLPVTCCGCRGKRCVIESVSQRFIVRNSLLLLFATGSLSGLLGGLFGTGGPPQMIAFSLLGVDKDTIRGVSTVYGMLELGMRVVMFTATDGSVFDGREWGVYLAIAGASWVGFTLGTWLRQWCNTDAIIRMLLLLVFASSGILLGALDDNRIAVGFGVGMAVWLAALSLLAWRPVAVDAALRGVWGWRCCGSAQADVIK